MKNIVKNELIVQHDTHLSIYNHPQYLRQTPFSMFFELLITDWKCSLVITQKLLSTLEKGILYTFEIKFFCKFTRLNLWMVVDGVYH